MTFLFKISLICAIYLVSIEALSVKDGNSRCKCACRITVNGTVEDPRVWVDPELSAEDCKCSQVTTYDDCENFCECAYENRNTTIIQVVVFSLITLITGLFIYMVFLLCLDPLINRKVRASRSRLVELDDGLRLSAFGLGPSTPSGALSVVTSTGGGRHESQIENDDDDINGDLNGRLRLESTSSRSQPRNVPQSRSANDIGSEERGRSSSVLSRLRGPHERWQGQLQNQRHNVYANRSVLN